MPYSTRLTKFENLMTPKTAHYNYEKMKCLALNSWVDVVTGIVVDINRFVILEIGNYC